MSVRQNSVSAFRLEALEARVLLSADGLIDVLPQVETTPALGQVEQQRQDGIAALDASLDYDPLAQCDQIFTEMEAKPMAAEQTVSDKDEAAASAQESRPEAAEALAQAPTAPTEVAALTQPVSQTDQADPTTQQLVDTLRAANGPPQDGKVVITPEYLENHPSPTSELGLLRSFRPGHSPGNLSIPNPQVWAGGEDYQWEINDVDAGEGTNPGWDLITINGTLQINATPASKFQLKVQSLTLANVAGNVADFSNTGNYQWRILTTSGGITGFNRDAINIDTAGFSNPLGTGAFVIDTSTNGKDLILRFVPSLPSVSLEVPTWTSIGPNVVNGNPNVPLAAQDKPAMGAVQAIVVHPTDPKIAWAGAVNGGIWVTGNFHWSTTNGIDDNGIAGPDDAAETPTWLPLAQDLPSLSIGALAVSAFDASNNPVTNATPLNQLVLFAGTGQFSSSHQGGAAAGLFRSLDGGGTWKEVGDFRSLRITSVVLSPQAAGLVFVGTHEVIAIPGDPAAGLGGLYRSTNRGDDWTRLAGTGGLPEHRVSDIVQEPGNASRFYVALAGRDGGTALANIGVYRTDNGDAPSPIFTPVNNGITPDFDHDGVLNEASISEEDLNNNSALDAGEDKDGDNVLDTVARGENLQNAGRIRLAVTSDPGHAVYAAIIGSGDVSLAGGGQLAGVFRSANNGGNWSPLGAAPKTNGAQGLLHFGIAASPGDNTTVYIAGDANGVAPFAALAFRWDNGTSTWTQITTNSGAGPNGFNTAPHADTRRLLLVPFNNVVSAKNGGLVMLSDGGVYRLTDPQAGGGTVWEFIGKGITATEMGSIAFDRFNGAVIAGTQDNGVISQTPGTNDWRNLTGGDGNFVDVAVHSTGATTRFYMSNNFQSFYRQRFDAFGVGAGFVQITLRSSAAAANFSGLDNSTSLRGLAADQTFGGFQNIPFAVNAVDVPQGPLFDARLALGRIGLYTSSDSGATITMAPGWVMDGFITALAYGGTSGGVAKPDVLFAAKSGSVFVSVDDGGNFKSVALGAGTIRQLSLDPSEWHTAFAVDSQHVWVLTVAADNSVTAVDITGDLRRLNLESRTIHSVEALRIKNELVLLVGASDGVYRLKIGDLAALKADPANQALWSRFGSGLPNTPVTDLEFDDLGTPANTADDVLIAGTLGRGAWKITDPTKALLADPVLRIDTGSGSDTVTVTLTPGTAATPRVVQVQIGASTWQFPASAFSRMVVHTGAGADTLIFDSLNGPLNQLRGVDFDGGDGSDTLLFQGVNAGSLKAKTEGAVQIRQLGSLKVNSTNTETFTNSSTTSAFLDAAGRGLGALVNWFEHLGDLLNSDLPGLGDGLGSGLEGKEFGDFVPFADNVAGEEAGSEGEVVDKPSSFLRRLLEKAGLKPEDIGTKIVNELQLQTKLDAMDSIPGNVTVDGANKKIVFGDLTDPNKPFKRTLDISLPLDAELLNGLIKLEGSLKLSIDVELMLEIGVDAGGFYVATAASPHKEITLRNLQVTGEVHASGNFGVLLVDVKDIGLVFDPDVRIEVDLLETPDPYGGPADGGRLHLYEFGNDPGGNIQVNFVGDLLQDDMTLTGTFNVAPMVPGTNQPLINLGDITLKFIWADITQIDKVRVETAGNPVADALMRFLNLGREELLGQLQRLMTFLDKLEDTPLLDVKLPFGNGFKLSGAFDFADGFLDKIYSFLVNADLTGSTQNSGAIAQGQLSADMPVTLVVDGADLPSFTVLKANTTSNSTLADLAADINAAMPAAVALKVRAEPFRGNINFKLLNGQSLKVKSSGGSNPLTSQLGFSNLQGALNKLKFPSLQSLLAKLNELLDPDGPGPLTFNLGIAFNQATKRLTFQVQFGGSYADTKKFKYDTDIGLGDLAEVSFSGDLNINASFNASFTLGIDWSSSTAPSLRNSFVLPPPANGKVTAPTSFTVNVNDGQRFNISVTPAETAAYTQLSQLIALLNTKLGAHTIDIDPTAAVNNKPLNQVVRFFQPTTSGGSPMVGIRLDAINEDKNNNGVLDAGEDVIVVNGSLDKMLDVINSLAIEAAGNSPAFTELGFSAFDIARSAIHGIYLENASLTGNATISATNLAASARFAIFGVSTSGGTATGTASVGFNLVNPNGGTRIDLDQMLGDLSNIGNYIGVSPTFNAGIDIHLKNIAVTPNLFASLLPPNAEFRIFIPDFRDVHFNADEYNSVTNNKGLFLTYPNLGPLLNFRCLGWTDLLIAIDDLKDQLEGLQGFGFLKEPLPLINMSVSQIIDFAGQISQTIQGLASGDGDTLDELEEDIEDLLGIPDSALDFSVEHTAVALTAGTGSSAASATFNPKGKNNALKFTGTANGDSLAQVVFLDDQTLAAGDQADAVYDATDKILTIYYNATRTSAATIRNKVNSLTGGALPFTATLDVGAEGGTNDGSGAVQQTALKMQLGYHLAYANTLPFQFSLKDLVNLLPANSPVRDLLNGVTDLFQAGGSGQLNVNASADMKLVFGIDVSSPCHWEPFLYDSDYNGVGTGTGITLAASVYGTNLDFNVSIGALGAWIKNGTATLDSDGLANSSGGDQPASFSVGLKDSNGDGRHYFRSGEAFFDSNNIGVDFTAGVSAVLPVYAPIESLPLGSSSDGNGDGYPDNDLVVIIPSLKNLLLPYKTDNTNVAVLRMPGTNNDLRFTGPAADREVKLIDDPTLAPNAPTATINGTTLEIRLRTGLTTAAQIDALANPVGWNIQLSTTDTGNTGAGKAYAPVTIFTPDIAGLFDDFNVCDIINNSGVLLDGLDALLETIQDALTNEVLNANLPLVGDKLKEAGNFIEEFREGWLAELRDKLAEVGSPIGLVQEAIYNFLGKPGLDLIVKSDGVTEIDSFDDVEIVCDGNKIEFKIRLKKAVDLVDTSANPIKFDIGIPGLGLAVDGNVKIEAGFDLKLYFGISASDGFYFLTGDDEELRVNFKITIPEMHAKGTLFFLQLDVNDESDGVDAQGNERNPSKFEGYFSVDVRGPPSGGGKLKFSDFSGAGFDLGDAFHAELGAVADINLDLALSFAGNAQFPRLLAEFDLDWSWTLGGDNDGALEFGFHNIQLDVGKFISDFIKPILEQVKKVTEPFQPLVDILTAPLPIFTELAGEPFDLLDLAELFGYLEPSTKDFIESLAKIITLINNTSFSNDGSILIPLGDFDLQSNQFGDVSRKGGGDDPEPDKMSEQVADTGTKNFLEDLEDLGFKFPFLSIGEIFKLFRGEPITIVEYHMPVLEFSASFSQSIPIYPPIYLVLGGEIGARIDLTFGYDTFGLQKFFSSSDKNVLDIFDGFFVKDVNDEGEDVPEIVLFGGLFAGASLNIGVAEVGVKGGIFVEIGFDLNDPDDDGKVRVSEIIANAKISPLCIFDVHGELYVELSVFLRILFFEKEWAFARITLLEFEATCPTPQLANYVDAGGNELDNPDANGILRINIGKYAEEREVGDTSDGDDHVIITHIGTESGTETVQVAFNGIKQTYAGVKKITVDAGQGNDTVDLRGVTSVAIVNGDDGNDTLYAGIGAGSVYHGNGGNDTITGQPEDDSVPAINDEFYGDAGSDVLTGNEGNDKLYGGDNADKIYGGAGNDTLEGGGGNDTLLGDVGTDSIKGGDGADIIKGEDDNDLLLGEGGDDTIEGGRGDDQIVGGLGNDKVDGQWGNDILLGDEGTVGAAAFSATAYPTTVTNINGDGADTVVGGSGADIIFAGGGNDKVFGGALLVSGSSSVTEPDGQDFIDAGAGNDTVFADDAHGGKAVSYPGSNVLGTAWFDASDAYGNVDNVRGKTEKGVANVKVELFDSTNTKVGQTSTDAAGEFKFLGLDAGDYYLKFTAPTGLVFATANAGSDDTLDSDADATGKTHTFTLEQGATEDTVSAGFHGTTPQVSIDNPSIAEGNSGLVFLDFTVTLSNPSSSRVTVCYKSASGAGPLGADRIDDFQSVSWTLVFEPGETVKVISVPIVGDNIDEGDYETFTVTLCDPDGANLDSAHTIGTGSIIDDDDPPTVNVADSKQLAPTVLETTPLSFEVSLSRPSKFTIQIDYTTAQIVNTDGTLVFDGAKPISDYENTYQNAPGTVTFFPGVTKQTVVINTAGDAFDEYDERMNLNIALNAGTASTRAVIGDAQAVGTIADDDLTPLVRITPVTQTVLEGHAGNTPANFTISLRDAANPANLIQSGRDVTVQWNTSEGTGTTQPQFSGDTPDVEYTFQTLVFKPGETSKNVTANVIGDTKIEPQVGGQWEYVFANLLTATNGQLDPKDSSLNHATVFIQDDEAGDPGPWYVQFSSANYTVTEGGLATISLVRAAGSSHPVAVYWTMNGTATHGSDYTGVWQGGAAGPRNVVYFEAGETLKTFSIQTFVNGGYEGTETVNLHLLNPTGGPVKGAIPDATLHIKDSTPPPTISISKVQTLVGPDLPAGVSESDPFLTFTVTVTGDSSVPVKVDWAAFNDTAKAPGDFSPAGGTLTFPTVTGSASQTVKAPVINDATAEELERMYARLILGTEQNATISDYEGYGYIYDDDATPVTGRVFFDLDGNGFFDSDEDYGLPGVKVTITDTAGPHSGTTDANGKYTISVYLGTNSIQVDETTTPSGSVVSTSGNPLSFKFTSTATSAPDIGFTVPADEDVAPESTGSGGGSNNDTVYGGPGNDDINGGGGDDWLIGGHWIGPGCACTGAGYNATIQQQAPADGGRPFVQFDPSVLGSIGDRVFLDSDGNGVRNGAEPGVKDIQVNLYDSQWQLVATTWTNAAGTYKFDKLNPCDYYVQVLPPAGYQFTTKDGGADNADSDVDIVTGLSGKVTVGAGQTISNIDAGLQLLPAGSPGPWSVGFGKVVYSVRETDGFATITVVRTPNSVQPHGVFFTEAGTATNVLDYLGLFENGAGSPRELASFGVDELEQSFVVPVKKDNLVESPETVKLLLLNPTGGPVKGQLPAATLLIFDDVCPDNDTIVGQDGKDVILGDYGYFASGAPVLLGGMGNDKISGENGDDTIFGEGGNDKIDGGADNDKLDGGSENDLYVFDGDKVLGSDSIIEVASPFGGNDTIDLSQTSGWSVILDLGSVAAQTVTPSVTITLPAGNVIENALGGRRNDVLTGNALDNRIEGGDGDDIIEGKGGNDALIGGKGSDTYLFDADAALGHDDIKEVKHVSAPTDVDLLDFGATTVQAVSIDLSLTSSQTVAPGFSVKLSGATGIENLYGGTKNDNLIGNSLDNVIWGREGNDNLDGNGEGALGDTLKEDRGSGFVLSDTTLTVTVTGEIDNYADFENVSLAGDNNANVLDASTFSGVVRLDGRGGNDTITGGTGTNFLTGGEGNDTIVASAGVDVISEQRDGNFVLTNGQLAITPVSGPVDTDTYDLTGGAIERANLTGGASANTLDASAFTGSVTLDGAGGNDKLLGTANADTLIGGAGDDQLDGRNGDDTYAFDADADLGSDTILETASGGTDKLDFSSTDTVGVIVNLGDNSLDPAVLSAAGATMRLSTPSAGLFAGTQTINTNLKLTFTADTLEGVIGSQSDDLIIGSAKADTIDGQEGNDEIVGGAGNDTLAGGSGINEINGATWRDRLVEARNANMTLGLGTLTIGAETDNQSGFETATLIGGAAANTINTVAFVGAVILDGADGNDGLTGGLGADALIGGRGDDNLQGGLGGDTYVFDADGNIGVDTLNDLAGVDTLDYSSTTTAIVSVDLGNAANQLAAFAPVTFTQRHRLTLSSGAMFENLTGGQLSDVLTGNGLANVIIGNDGNDALTGEGGNDRLVGGNGNDRYIFDADLNLGTDVIAEEVGIGGSDTLDFSATTAAITVDLSKGLAQTVVAGNLTLRLLTCHSVENVIGGVGGDTLTGNTLDNRLEGRAGNDVMTGGRGNDTYFLDADTALGTDTINEDADSEGGNDTLDLTGTASLAVTVNLANAAAQAVNANLTINLSSGAAVEDVLGGAQGDTLTGNSLNNVLRGFDGNDQLLGGAGADTLEGGNGNDSLQGGAGPDVYVFNADAPLGADSAFEVLNAGRDTLDFSATTLLGVQVNLALTSPQAVNANLTLTLNSGSTFEVAVGGAERDVLTGAAVASKLLGGAGNDILVSGPRDDVIEGGDGDDRIVFLPTGTLDGDLVEGGNGVDTLDFSAFAAGVKVDLAIIGVFQTILTGEQRVSLAAEDVEGAAGGAGADVLLGNDLDNRIAGNGGVDQINGRAGLNTVVAVANANMILTPTTLDVGGSVDSLANIQAADLTGGGGNNTLDASAFLGSVRLDGDAGNDILVGGAGNDTLIGGKGDDTLKGGAGNDTYAFDVDNPLDSDIIDEAPGPANGVDTLDFSATETVALIADLGISAIQTVHATNLKLTLVSGGSVENLIGGAKDDKLTGNALDNQFTGGLGNDIIDGLSGVNSLMETRDNFMALNNASFQVVDRVTLAVIESDALTNIQRATLTGGANDDKIDASSFTAGDVTLIGLAGDDTLFGGSKNDLLDGGDGFDVLKGGDGDDLLWGGLGHDNLAGGNGKDTLRGDDGNDDLVGGPGDDTYLFDLTVGQGEDMLTELAGPSEGNDALSGFASSVVDLSSTDAQLLGCVGAQCALILTLTQPNTVELAI